MCRLLPWTVTLVLTLCLAACASAQPSARSTDDVRASGSLRGTDLDGDWVVAGPRGLRPDAALIRRFDHLLTAAGEVDLREMRRWIEREVTQQRDAATASQVLTAWDEHLAALQGRPTPTQEAAGNPYPVSTPAPAPRPRKPVATPRSLLTPDPAGAEQQALQAQRVQAFGPEAAERLRAEDTARWAWAQRLADARSHLQALSGAARDTYLARQFTGNELLRARALLGLSP
ncbi:MAG: hypothetical protein ABI605_01235 [Rhizobacter sp.]